MALIQERDHTVMNINITYPNDPMFEFHTMLEKINLDREREKDIYTGNGFAVSEPRSIKKDLKDINGIFSSRFGQTLGDMNPFIDRYKCPCGFTRQRINHGTKCPICGGLVEYVDDDFEYFGWIPIKEPHAIIHPLIYRQIEFLCGNGINKKSKLDNMLNYIEDKDTDGYGIKRTQFPKDEPFLGIGMNEFRERFDEIMLYYLKKKPNKQNYYDDIMNNKEKIFIHGIPVFTTHLRPTEVTDENMNFEPINGMYNMINKFASKINNNRTKMARNYKVKMMLLYNTQMKYMELYDEIIKILSGKKGQIRCLVGGRYNFSSRCVIVQDPSLRIDQVTLPYKELVIILEQRIINVLVRAYNMTFSDAYNTWYKAVIEPNPAVRRIIEQMIKANPEGMPLIINRNPSIGYGSILQVFCVGITDTFTLGIPLQILKLMAADFDGDVYNIFHIINDGFFQRAFEIFNPRNAMYISRNDGTFNTSVCPQRDTLINANTLLMLGRDKYTPEQLKRIMDIKLRRGF